MATWKIVKKEDLSIACSYEGVSGAPTTYGGPWGDTGSHQHVLTPEELDPECVKAELVEDVITIVEDATLTAEKLQRTRNAKLDRIRELRVSKMTEVDIQCNLFILDDQLTGQGDWKTYRQALCDVTNTYKDQEGDATSAIDAVDPETFSWPSKPS